MKKLINRHFKDFLFDWNYGTYFLLGGYGSSKSYHVALKILLKLLTERRTCLCVREVFETIRESCYSLFAEICAGMELPVIFKRSPMQMSFPNGSRIIFRGLDKPEKLKSINDVSLIWLEEASEIKYAGFKELLGRLRHPKLSMHVILSLNPTSRSNWTYKHFFAERGLRDEDFYSARIIKAHDTYYHHSVADDNKFLPAEYVARLDEMKTYDADLYRIARLGRFGVNGVRVLPQFEVGDVSAINKIPRRFHYTGMDFGFETSYNAVIRCAVDDANKWLYIYDEYYRNRMTDDETADELERLGYKGELIKADSAEPKAIAYYRKRGFKMTAAHKWSGGTKHARLDNTRKIKRFKRIICAASCRNAIRELGELTYKQDKDGEIIGDEFNLDSHCLSAIWYALDNYELKSAKIISKRELGL